MFPRYQLTDLQDIDGNKQLREMNDQQLTDYIAEQMWEPILPQERNGKL